MIWHHFLIAHRLQALSCWLLAKEKSQKLTANSQQPNTVMLIATDVNVFWAGQGIDLLPCALLRENGEVQDNKNDENNGGGDGDNKRVPA